MTVHEIETQMSSAEITEWMAYFKILSDMQEEEMAKAKALNDLKRGR